MWSTDRIFRGPRDMQKTGVWLVLGLFGVLAVLGPSSALASIPDGPLAVCEQQLAEQPGAYASYLCFYLEYRGAQAEVSSRARLRLEELGKAHPELGWPALVGGYFADMGREDSEARALYEEAARAMERRGEAEGLMLARSNLRRVLQRLGEVEAAARQVELARRVATSTDDAVARARFLTLEASHHLDTLGDLSAAYRSLYEARGMVFPEGPFGLQRSILVRLASLAYHLGHYDEAIAAHAQTETLLLENGTLQDLASNAYNWATSRLAMLEIEPEPGGLAEVEQRARHALALALEHRKPDIAAVAHAMLARVLAPDRAAEARGHLDACHDLAARHDLLEEVAGCWWRSALARLGGDPQDDHRAASRAVEAAEATDNDLLRAHAWRARLRTAWLALPTVEADAEVERALTAIETLRERQLDAGRRAQMIGGWSADYTWLAGRQIEDRNDLAAAFATFERLRARVLLESLDRPPESSRGVEPKADLATVRRQIAHVQRRLLDPGLDAVERATLLARLEGFELEERSHRPSVAEVKVDFPSLGEVAASLTPDEALLIFQVDLETDLFGLPAGGSWVLVISREGHRAVPLGDRSALVPAIPMLRGLVERRDGNEVETARILYRRLLADALAGLDASIERLILVPDGPLHQLPFALLEGPEGPLGLSRELVVAPSATLWYRWRRAAVKAAEQPALVFADPTLGGGGRGPSATRNAVLLGGLELGALPQARHEGRRIRRLLGARLLVGEGASEHALRAAEPSRYGIIHFATHALADLERPERSSLLLAPGGEEEDGLLRAPEVAELDFGGRAVVLSACQTAHGEVLRGEGILSLSRAFFEAGAHAVIGSRWPLRDDEAAVFFELFYRRLAAGDTLAAALRAARREARAAGLPAEAWAGPVLVGRGDLTVTARPPRRWWIPALVVAAGLLTGPWLLRACRRFVT